MVKLYIALGLALVVTVVTAAVGLAKGVRLPTVLYRSAISLVGCALAAYLAAYLAEGYYRRRFGGIKPGRNKVDIISKDGIIDNDELLNPSHATPQFNPMDPESLEHVSVK
ncbi:hypothetical protein [Anaeroselena agilis]|uniref:Uncharacterized protein n=1 Tax=Anaeroselena agilis TaxID=3063788 RepID=A0ABU3NWX0_9FIRM|nr:hypothetical protein [Selenomonadales bacterium 4137-cl]